MGVKTTLQPRRSRTLTRAILLSRGPDETRGRTEGQEEGERRALSTSPQQANGSEEGGRGRRGGREEEETPS